MQNARYDSETYRKAASAGWPVENRWTNPELNLQPHAYSMHAAAGGARGSQLQRYEINNHAPAITIDDLPDHAVNKNIQLSHHVPDLMCPYPKCFATFPQRWMVHLHFEVHLNTNRSTSIPVGIPKDSVAIYRPASAFTTNASPHARGFYDHDQDIPSEAITGTSNTALMPVYTNNSMVEGHAEASGSSPTMTSGTSTPGSTPTGTNPPFPCRYPGCSITCGRRGDLRRHELVHAPGPKRYDCPNLGCLRKGRKGFDRMDKMLSHHKVHRQRGGRGGS
ncbi:MAG: hypothetical protein Q9223_003719 [Gallowayella weberi]